MKAPTQGREWYPTPPDNQAATANQGALEGRLRHTGPAHPSPLTTLPMHPALPPMAQATWLAAAAAVGLGAALGALLRWRLAAAFNHSHAWLPMGTLVANLLGGYLVGVAVAAFAQHPQWPQTWRLFVITGFLGGLTTFSSFSAEVVALLQQARLLPALATAGLHLAGSLVATALGVWTWQLLRS